MDSKKNILINFVQSLHDRGLLIKGVDEFDYEWVVWDYLKSIDKANKKRG